MTQDLYYFDSGYYSPDLDYFVYTADAESKVQSTVTVSISTSVIKPFSVAISSQFTVSSTISDIRGVDMFAFSNASINITVKRLRNNNIAASSAFTIVASGVRSKYVSASCDSSANISILASSTRIAQAAPSAAFSISLISKVNKTFSVNVSSYFNENVSINFINKRPFTLNYRFNDSITPLVDDQTNGAGYPHLVSDYKKYGNGSLYTPGKYASNYFTVEVGNSTTNWGFASNQDFYISLWTYVPNAYVTTGLYVPLLGNSYTGSSGNGWNIGYWSDIAVPQFRYRDSGGVDRILQTTGPSSVSAAWQHWEIYRNGSTITFKFFNGFSTTVSVTRTDSGAIACSGPLYISAMAQPNGSRVPVYYDELYIAKGINSVQNYTSSNEIYDGALTSTNLLLHFNESLQEDIHGIVSISAALSSAASVSANVGKQVVNSAALSSAASVSAIVGSIKQNGATLQSNGFVTVAIGRIRPFIDLESSAFSLTANGIITKFASASLNSASTIFAIGTKTLGPITTNLNSSVILTANGIVSTGSVISVSSAFTLIANTRKFEGNSAALSSTASLSVSALKVQQATSNISSQFAVTASAIKTSRVVSNLNCVASLNVSIIHDVGFISTPSSAFSIACSTKVNKPARAIVSSVASLSLIPKVIKKTSVSLSSAFSITINNTRRRAVTIATTAIATEVVAISRILKEFASLYAVVTVHVNVGIISTNIRAPLTANARLTVTATRIEKAQANLSSISHLTILGGARIVASANLQCEGFEVAFAKVINLSHSAIWKVPYESTTWIIKQETNEWIVPFENREYKIKG
jgi:hypothetical protein